MKFTIPGKPFGKMRPRKGKFSVYDPKENKQKEENIRRCFIKDHGTVPEQTEYPVWLNIDCYFQIPKTAPKKKREAMLNGKITPLIRPDLDNIAKTVMDAMNGFFYKDDRQVVLVRVAKHYGETAKTVVDIGRYYK